jgi:hypothetical protein
MTAADLKGQPVTHSELVSALANRYAMPHWFLMETVHDTTGFDKTRTADAVAYGLYASRGFEVHGFEAKAQRGDFLRELEDVTKSAWLIENCDRFFIVAPDASVAKASELPAAWGLLYVKRNGEGFRISTAKPAEPLWQTAGGGARTTVSKQFAAAMLMRMEKRCDHRVKELDDASAIQDRLNAARADGVKWGRDCAERDAKNDERGSERLRAAITLFEEKSGVTISEYAGPHFGEAFRVFLRASQDLDFSRVRRGLLHTAEADLAAVLESVKNARQALEVASVSLAEKEGQA